MCLFYMQQRAASGHIYSTADCADCPTAACAAIGLIQISGSLCCMPMDTCRYSSVLPLDVPVLQQPMLPLDMSVQQQHLLPLDLLVPALKQTLLLVCVSIAA
jgi:hypothetical protein